MYYNLPLYIISLLIIYIFIFNTKDSSNDKNYLKNIINQQERILLKLKNKVDKKKSIENMENTSESIQHKQKQPQQTYKLESQQQIDPVYIRDQMVLNDRLYPPLARTERPQFDLLMNYINSNSGIFNINTRGPPDTFRSVGYLTPVNKEQTIDSTLILYGRAKYPNSDMGEFYVSSSNKMSDIKIPLNEYNSNVRKITDIPPNINITGNILNGRYNFTELPKANLDYPYI